ncbi:hypothetical protein QYM36_011605 [Artemia franciscana]|uniref:Uncharacterized protein n=1 Tax=Artemia franciscana TaxID=6661 RepID=A0AA88HS69_ARTSF|nr:hypothetical protein QYM36_011605 [Artemia franciscana]
MTNEDKMNEEPAFVRKGLKTKYFSKEKADPNLKDEKGRKSSDIAAEDDTLYICQPLAYENEAYVTEPLLEKGKQTEKQYKPLFTPRKEQCACRNISNLVKSEDPRTLKNIPVFGKRPSAWKVVYEIRYVPRKVGNETVIKHKIRAFFPSWKITTIIRIVENNEIATYKVVENGVKTTITVENGVVKSQTVYCTKCGFRNSSDLAIQIRYNLCRCGAEDSTIHKFNECLKFKLSKCFSSIYSRAILVNSIDSWMECNRRIQDGERWTRENDIHKIRLRY